MRRWEILVLGGILLILIVSVRAQSEEESLDPGEDNDQGEPDVQSNEMNSSNEPCLGPDDRPSQDLLPPILPIGSAPEIILAAGPPPPPPAKNCPPPFRLKGGPNKYKGRFPTTTSITEEQKPAEN